jgi:hypothetical protein
MFWGFCVSIKENGMRDRPLHITVLVWLVITLLAIATAYVWWDVLSPLLDGGAVATVRAGVLFAGLRAGMSAPRKTAPPVFSARKVTAEAAADASA